MVLMSKFDVNFAVFSVWLRSYRYFDWYSFDSEWFFSFERIVSVALEQFFGFLVLVQQLVVVLLPVVVPIHYQQNKFGFRSFERSKETAGKNIPLGVPSLILHPQSHRALQGSPANRPFHRC